ncbi:MAG: hypothetical protein K2I29_01480, partial [Clostridia bacterium]|nr:hypothetical protein [Clostridia bacterium]
SARLNNGEISWLRSGNGTYASAANYLGTDGSNVNNSVTSSYAVRPALHLNLKSAASAAGLVVDAPTFKDGTITKTVVYNGKEQEFELTTPEKGVSVAVSSPAAYDSTSHKIKATAAGTYTVTLSPNAGYGWSDGSIGPKQLTITIKPKELTAINWLNGTSALASDGKVTYTGNQIIINATADGADISTTDKETVKLPVIISGDNVNEGTFTATAINTNPNYVFSSSLDTTKTVTIEKKAISVDWNVANNAQFVYNGENFAPEATFIAANGLPVTLPVTLTKGGTTVTEAVDAGEYVATVAAGDYFSNYNLASAATVSFKINKAQITASDVEWSFTEGAKFATGAKPSLTALYRYNNVTYSLTIAITTTDGNTTTWAAGGYTATASLATGMDNFEISGTVSRTFNLTETASGNYTVIWEGYSSVANYNGADQKPSGYIISDGEKLAINVAVEKWNGSAWVAATSAKDAGTYRFTATKDGYKLLNDKVECRIDPRVISVDYANLTGLTHGTTTNVIASTTDPVAKAEVDAGILTFAVTGSGRVAGTHVVSVEAQVDGVGGSKVASGNYSISNSTAVQTIGKKVLTANDIDWTLSFTYDGNIKIPEGKVKASALTASDLAGGAYVIFEFVYAVNAGNYNVKVLGISNDNYTYSGEMTLTIKDREISTVMWEGVQDGNSVVYNKIDQAPKAYIMIDGEKVYLDGKLEKYDPTTSTWSEVAYAINAGNFRLTVAEVASGSGNYFYSESVNSFTISRYELTAIYLTQNVFTYSGSNAGLEVYALGVGNERISVRDFTVLDGLGQPVTVYSDAGSYSVQVAIQTALGSNTNYTISSVLRTTFVINPQVVNVTFEITGNNWSWKADVATVPTVTVSASVANAIEVRYGKLGADNTKPAATNQGLSFVFQITGISGDGIITAVAKSKNYQITGTNVKTFNVIPVDGEATATFSFDGDVWSDDNLEFEYNATSGKTVAVSGDNDVEIKYYKDGVLLSDPVTTTAGLDAGTYLVTASCPTRQLSTNITATTRTFKILPKEVDFADVDWVIDGNKVAGNTVSYNGQIYSATLDLGELADDFEVYYTNGTYKNVGNVRTTATIVAKNSNYKAVGAVESYDWAISGATATVAWNDDGTVASIAGDSAAATGGSFFEKSGTSY